MTGNGAAALLEINHTPNIDISLLYRLAILMSSSPALRRQYRGVRSNILMEKSEMFLGKEYMDAILRLGTQRLIGFADLGDLETVAGNEF